MVNLLPAILIGGPPNAGKSVLTYSLTQALRQRNIPHYVIRANPDGEGDWSQEMENEKNVRQILIKGKWSVEFVQRICADMQRRHLPLLVDIGGLPTEKEGCIFQTCTHSLLLLRVDQEDSAQDWRNLVSNNGLLPLAELYSQQSGISSITSQSPVIMGSLTGLERRNKAHGPMFDVLIERIATLFGSYSLKELEKIRLDLAPTELVADLDPLLQMLAPGSHKWQPAYVPRVLLELPANTALAVHGRAPGWIYAALSVHTGEQAFYQFNPRLGWVPSLPLQLRDEKTPEIDIEYEPREDETILRVNIVAKNLDYAQSEYLPFPPVPTDRGLILSGEIPQWLLTSLVRLYFNAGLPWIAYDYPPLHVAVVVASHTSVHYPGDQIPMSIS
jgi:CRISPR-associated protein Csx3